MKEYTITRYTGPESWATAPKLEICEPLRPQYANVPIQAWAQVCYDDEALYVHLWAKEENIRAELHGLLDEICEDSCLEFFFQPVAGDPRYINMEFNSNGCLFLGMGTGIEDLIRLLPLEETSQIFCPEIRMIPGGWEIFYRIPYSFIRQLFPTFAVQPEMQLRANCYACSDLTQPHYYLSWNPVATDRFTFHRSSCFGNMIIKLQY